MSRMASSKNTRNTSLQVAVAVIFGLSPCMAVADASLSGQSGLVNMPDARIQDEGTFGFGVNKLEPYYTLWSSLSVLPRLEVSARFTRIDGVPGADPSVGFGDYRDKSFDAKFLLFRESEYFPAVSVGAQDFTGTRLFSANYLALSKKLGDLDLTLGYGTDRIDGVFGGIRYRPSWHPNLGFVVEYDANDYVNDFRAAQSGANQRKGGATYALEYKYGWIGTQLSYQGGDIGGNLYLAIPLMEKEYVPKIDEPEPYAKITAQPSIEQMQSETGHAREMIQELERQGFKNIRLRLDGKTIEASLTHPRITLLSRAVGRAARTVLLLGPAEIERLSITYTENDLPVLTYHFTDAKRLRSYFVSLIELDLLEDYVDIQYATPEYASRFRDKASLLELDDTDDKGRAQTFYGEGAHAVSIRREDPFLSGFQLIPFNVRLYFINPNGDASYDTFTTLAYQKHFGQGWFLNGAARLTLFENVSDADRPSVSVLPHVRTDIPIYKQEERRLKLNGLLLNKYTQHAERIYSRFSAGYYEEMFAGAGGQVLYLPKRGDWAVDFSLDWLRQREPESDFGFRDYSVATALLAVHYRIPKYGITTTARIGRFLAKDEGVRFEIKRRFHSGIEAGIWFTRTNENDQTQPNRPKEEFLDRGLFVSIPLASMLTKDTRERASIALVEATRDVGQMVESPGDLYRLFEQRLSLDAGEIGPFTNFDK